MHDETWLAALNQGDIVGVRNRSNKLRLSTVQRVSNKHVWVDGVKYHRDSGYQPGKYALVGAYLVEATDSLIANYEDRQIRQKLICEIVKLSDDLIHRATVTADMDTEKLQWLHTLLTEIHLQKQREIAKAQERIANRHMKSPAGL